MLQRLLSLSWPIVLARASQSVIGFADALMVAPLGEPALAAVTTGAINFFAAIVLPMGVVFLLQSFTSQLRGAGRLESVHRFAYYGAGIALAAAVLAALAIPLVPLLLEPFAYEPAVKLNLTTYLGIRLLAVGPVIAMEAFGNWYGGLGNTRAAMLAGVVAMVANVAGNYLLIEPRFGLPGYGVAGAAWASVAASAAGAAAIAFLYARGLGLPGPRVKVRLSELRADELYRLLRFGVPNGVNWFLELSAFAVFINVVVAHLGTAALAAFNVVIQLNALSFMPAFGFGTAGAILVGEAIGRRAHDEAGQVVRVTLFVAATWMASVGVVYVTAPDALMRMFSESSSDELVRVGAVMLVLSAFWQLFDAAGITLSEALRAAGDTTFCMVARIVVAWCVFVPGAFLCVIVAGGGVYAVMGMVILYLALLSAAFGRRFASGHWRSIDLVGQRKAALGGEL